MQLLAKLPSWRLLGFLAEDEEAAAAADEQSEGADHVAVSVGEFAVAGELGDCLPNVVGAHAVWDHANLGQR